MTAAEWTADGLNILLIVIMVCVSVAGVVAVKGFVGEGMLNKRSVWFASVFGFLFMVYLIPRVLADLNLLTHWGVLSDLRKILPEDWAQIFLVLGLVVATGFYALMAFRQAKATKEQADASVEMAKQMRKQTETLRETVNMSIRPEVSVEVLNIKEGGNYLFEPPSEFYVELKNTGKGRASNLVVTCEGQDKKVEYTKIELPYLNVGDKKRFSIHRETPISGDGLRVAYVLLKALYNDELGEIWSITQQIDKDNKWKAGELTPPEKLWDNSK